MAAKNVFGQRICDGKDCPLYEAILFQNGEAMSHRVSSLDEVREWAQEQLHRKGGYVKIYKEPDRTFVEIIKIGRLSWRE
ncbi:hypothetical protein CW696_05290 [ANME-2 cluster archaeon]|nr:MAG: hypothetical protein CW696_05290 [ANME-2 cluster archaeon]